jgi:hypothetical protein
VSLPRRSTRLRRPPPPPGTPVIPAPPPPPIPSASTTTVAPSPDGDHREVTIHKRTGKAIRSSRRTATVAVVRTAFGEAARRLICTVLERDDGNSRLGRLPSTMCRPRAASYVGSGQPASLPNYGSGACARSKEKIAAGTPLTLRTNFGSRGGFPLQSQSALTHG